MTSWRAKVDAVAVSPSGQASRSNTSATVRSDRPWSRSTCPAGHLPDQVSGSWPRSAASVRHRPYRCPAASCSLGLRVAWTAHLTSRASAPAPRPPAAPPPGRSGRCAWRTAGPGPRAGPGAPGCHGRPLLSTPPRASGQLALVGGPVDGVRGQPMPVQVPAVQRCPASVRSLDPVGHHQMGVQQRITLPDVRWSNPTASSPCPDTCWTPPWPRRAPKVSVQVGDRLGHAGMVGGQHRPAGGRVTQAVEDRDALGRPQDHVERGHGVAAMGAAQQLARRGVAALEHGLEPGRRCFALQPQAGGAGAVPPAWGLAVAGQIRSWSVASSRV